MRRTVTVRTDQILHRWEGGDQYRLRHGDNPHQSAWAYRHTYYTGPSVLTAKQLNGDRLSGRNILDFDAALRLLMELEEPACTIVKHTNTCGCAMAEQLVEAYTRARDTETGCDPQDIHLLPQKVPQSRYGGIVGFNRQVGEKVAETLVEPGSYYHGIIAPEFTPEARRQLVERWPNIVLLATGEITVWSELAKKPGSHLLEQRSILGGSAGATARSASGEGRRPPDRDQHQETN
jgi:phosphoribosylaminoimidazolecarboxamide formyltransferase / IMP cyclohydrolase